MSGLDTVRSGITGRIIPCCWAECDRAGRQQFSIRVVEARGPLGQITKTTTYLFCSHRHRVYYAHGTKAYGRLPAGLGNLDGHVTVPAQHRKATP